MDVGFACGMERVLLVLGQCRGGREEPGVKVFAAYQEEKYFGKAFGFLRRLRGEGVSGDIDYQGRSLKSQMKLADRLKAEFVVIVSDEIVLRNMSAGSQESMSFENAINILKNNNSGD